MKNGPVISNISLINKAFLEIGSPLHYKLIVDYLRINWDHGKGISEAEAQNILNIALNAKYYYEEVEEQHFQRKQFHCSDLDVLYDELKQTKVPVKQNTRKPLYKMTDLYTDPRFTIMVTEASETYILLSEWNLINDLAIRLFIKEEIHTTSIFEVVQLIKERYQITDRNALFLPHFDHRFIVTKKGMVSLKSYDESQIQTYTIEVTTYIREEVARRTPKLLSILEDHYGEEVKIRTLIKSVFNIEAHTPKFGAYFVAIKEYLPSLPNIRLTQQEDSVIFIENEEATIVDKVSLQGVTDKTSIVNKINTHSSGNTLLEDVQVKQGTTQHMNTRTSLTYTIRYYDRIQETLAAHYFKDWIGEDELTIELIYGNESTTLILFYDREKNILHGPHLENLMSDYALIPGQKLHFQLEENNRVTLRIGNASETDIKEQERYLDIARLVQENRSLTKSLLQIVTEILIYHPSGLHVSEISRLVKEEAPYAESSISATLSMKDYFKKIPNQSGFWRFNPAKWKKTNFKESGKQAAHTRGKANNKRHTPQKVKPMHELFQEYAKKARKRKQRLTNEMYQIMNKDTFLEHAWTIYANNIFNFAERYASPEIPLEDYFQEAYFALEHAYENYDPSFGGSFYNYFKRYLSSFSKRYLQNNKNLIRIPIHRLEELERVDKESEMELLLKGIASINNNLEEDYTLWKTNYISFEDWYIYESNFSEIDDEAVRGRIFSYFSNQYEFENRFLSDQFTNTYYFEEPDITSFIGKMYEDEYNLMESDFFIEMWDFIDEKARTIKYSEVLKQRFGFNREKCELTLEKVGEKLGVSRQRILQIENLALERAQQFCRFHGFKAEHFGLD